MPQPKLRLTVIPKPVAARTLPNPVCHKLADIDGKQVCRFDVADPAKATTTVALVGDSHAGMWRVALDPVAKALGWYSVHMGHASCPLNTALRDLPEPNRSHCIRWKRDVFAWFKSHPEASTLMVSQLTGGSGVVPSDGHSEYGTEIAGYMDAWKSLPPTVKHIVVIRDTPKTVSGTPACIERALSRHVPPGPACAVPRRSAVDPDPAADAAARMHSSEVATVDLTSVFCDPGRCYPVIGGALVYRDTTHMLPGFGRTLAPLLQRHFETLVSPGRDSRACITFSGGRASSFAACRRRALHRAARRQRRRRAAERSCLRAQRPVHRRGRARPGAATVPRGCPRGHGPARAGRRADAAQ